MSFLGLADKCWLFSMRGLFANDSARRGRGNLLVERQTSRVQIVTHYAEELKSSQAPNPPPFVPGGLLMRFREAQRLGTERKKWSPLLSGVEGRDWLERGMGDILW